MLFEVDDAFAKRVILQHEDRLDRVGTAIGGVLKHDVVSGRGLLRVVQLEDLDVGHGEIAESAASAH